MRLDGSAVMKVQPKKVDGLLREFLEKHSLRYTPERKTILQEVCSMRSHFEADALYLRLRQQGSTRISRATVYRTLPLLEESGIIRRIVFNDKHTYYEVVYEHLHHEHFICLGCGKVIEFYNQSFEDSLDGIAREHAFTPVDHKLEIRGYCKQCATLKGDTHAKT